MPGEPETARHWWPECDRRTSTDLLRYRHTKRFDPGEHRRVADSSWTFPAIRLEVLPHQRIGLARQRDLLRCCCRPSAVVQGPPPLHREADPQPRPAAPCPCSSNAIAVGPGTLHPPSPG